MTPDEKVSLIRKGKADKTLIVDDIKATGFTKFTCPWCKKEKKSGPSGSYASAIRVSCYVGDASVEVYVCETPCYGEIVGGEKESPFWKTLRTGKLG